MKITDVRIKLVTTDNRLKALASLTFDDCFVVHELRVIEGDKGLFVVMPSRKTPSGEYRDTAHPIKSEFRKEIEESVINAYQAALLLQTPTE